MGATTNTPAHERRQYVAFGVLSLVAAGFTGILSLSQGGAGLFEAYFGSIPPLLAIALTALLGFVSLAFLYSRGWFEIYASRSLRGVGFSAAIAGAWELALEMTHESCRSRPRRLSPPRPGYAEISSPLAKQIPRGLGDFRRPTRARSWSSNSRSRFTPCLPTCQTGTANALSFRYGACHLPCDCPRKASSASCRRDDSRPNLHVDPCHHHRRGARPGMAVDRANGQRAGWLV